VKNTINTDGSISQLVRQAEGSTAPFGGAEIGQQREVRRTRRDVKKGASAATWKDLTIRSKLKWLIRNLNGTVWRGKFADVTTEVGERADLSKRSVESERRERYSR